MTIRRRVVKAAAIAAVALFVLGICGVLLAPFWIHLDPVRRKIESAASSSLGGAVTIERIDLSFFPRPGAALHRLSLDVRGKIRGTVRTVRVSPLLAALLRGRFRPANVRLEGPDLRIDLPGTAPPEAATSSPDPLARLRPILHALAPEGSGLTGEIIGGSVAVYRDGMLLAELRDVTVSVAVSPRTRSLHADVKASAAYLSLRRGTRRALEAGGLSVAGAVDSLEGKTVGSLSRFSLESPRVLVEGSLQADSAAPRVEVAATGGGLDVTTLREKLLAFAGDDPTLRGIFAILRGGTLTSFSFASAAESPAELGVLEKMSIKATLADGSVRIASVGLDLAEASGEVAIEKGVLSAESAAARIGSSRAWEGSVRVGLAPGDDTLRVEARVRSDLAELPAILERALGASSFRRELSSVENLSGSATGRLVLENRAGKLRATVSVSDMKLSGEYRKIPFPVSIDHGTFFYDGTRLAVGRLSGTLGRSKFSGLTARLRLGDTPLLEDIRGGIQVSLDEVFPWLSSKEGMDPLRAEIRQARGSLGLEIARLSGPVSRPGDWQYEASGTLKNFVLVGSFLPEALEVNKGNFRMDGDAVRATGLEARMMDATLRVSGGLDGYRGGIGKLEATADGEIGPQAVRWIWKKVSLPDDFRPAAPIGLGEVRLGLARGGSLSLAGTFAVHGGPRVALDLVEDTEGTDVRRLAIADKASNASLSFRRRKGVVGAGFEGRLESATLAELLATRREWRGRIAGSFRARLPLEHPETASVEGTLEANDIDVPTPAGRVTIERLGLRGAGSRLDVTGSSFVLEEQRFSATGSATFRGEGLVLDMDVATGDVSWEMVEKVLDRMKATRLEEKGKETTSPTTPVAAPPFRLGGALHLTVGSFAFKDLSWKPVQADVTFGADAVTATVRQAEVCGISTTGTLRFLRGGALGVEARALSAGPDVNAPLTCLGLEDVRMTGSYEAGLAVEGTGEASELLRAVRGPLALEASKGTIGKADVLTKILGALNATQVFSGSFPGLFGTSIPYDGISITGEVGSGRVTIHEGALNTPSFTMAGTGSIGLEDRSLDFMVLSHPFSTVDKVLQKIPILRYILGGNFLSVAATVTGNLDDPKVSVTPGRDVSEGLVHILERTAKLPVRVFEASPSGQ